MCRWLAYSGAPIFIDEALFMPEHSLINQSQHARASATTINGDGFGVGWYGKREFPGVFKDVRPAWNDNNLRALASQIEAPMFLAHVRATTGSEVQRSNCHPFQHRNWLFVHNGEINEFQTVRRDLALAIDPELYPLMSGTTDSEVMFLLALSFGLMDDVAGGVARMTGLVENVCREHGIENAMQMTLGISDGRSLYAVRYSTEGRSRSLYHSASIEAIREMAPEAGRFSANARAIVSEPLNKLDEAWIPVPESSFVTISDGEVSCEDFAPQQAA